MSIANNPNKNIKPINVPEFDTEIRCKSIIVPLLTDKFPIGTVIVLDKENMLKAYVLLRKMQIQMPN